MITFSKLGHSGQLGNQLWQYALLRSVAERLETDIAVPMHRTAPKKAGLYELEPFNVACREFNPQRDRVTNRYSEPSLHFHESALQQPDGTDFYGCFQSWKYLGDHESLRRDFQLREPDRFSLDRIVRDFRKAGRRLVAVNVRRGDYVGTGYHLVLPASWYLDAISTLDDGCTDFVCVSDGLPWCRESIKHPRMSYFVPSSHWQAFGFMCCCDGMIGSASSFSWWAAWLQGEGKPKIFPGRWYGPNGPAYFIDDILPTDWTRQ